MANVKFKKVQTAPTDGMTAGDIIFCTGDHTVYVATGAKTKEAFYGGRIKDIAYNEDTLVLTVYYQDTEQVAEIDLGSFNTSLEALANLVASQEKKIKALEDGKLSAGKDIDITGANNAIDVALDADITVMGVTVGTLSNNQKLTKGMSLSDILKKILIKVIDAKVGALPSVTLSATGITNGQRVEVGSSVTATLSHTYTDGKFVGAESAYSYNQAAGCTKGAVKYFCNGSEVESPHTPSLTEGTYAYKCTVAYGANTNKPIKNNGTQSSVSIPAGTATSNVINIYARYPIYTNGVTSNINDTTAPTVTATADSTKLPLVDNNTQFGVAFAAMTPSTGYRLLLHTSKTIKSAKALNGLTGKYDIDVTSKFVKGTSTVTKPVGTGSSSFYVWEYKATEGANRVIFTIA